ncbi:MULTISPECIES: hypothetical protein [Thermofilum]|uniref:Uncharacterized protein n=1 Tax=Thermofilum adornatum 1505 TaxID=697581 RepID=A0A3G1A4H6_9CREN|nr:hypothetical protein [Thermofilum adornatum]AJB41369.1 hypothetical protein TCARB_0293 [Thermofilum adornatum 1505]
MEATLEYLAVGLLIVLLILVSYGMVNATTSTVATTYEEQLYTIAERVMDKLILTPGYPVDWGTNIQVTPDTLQDFGLALYGARSPYIVDPDKVMRLANLSTLPNPLLLNTTRLAQLLNLEDYGFRLKIRPMLLINITPAGYYYYQSYTFISAYDFLVTNYYGLGIPNANITAMYVVVRVQPGASNNEGDVETKTILTKTCLTNAVGKCRIDYTSDLASYFSQQKPDKWFYTFLIARAEWQGFISVAGYASTSQGGVPAEGYIIGNYVFVNKDIDSPVIRRGNRNAGAVLVKDDLLQAVPEYQDLLNFTTVTWCRDSSGNFRNDDPLCNNAGRVLPSAKQWYLVGYIQYVEPLSSHIFIFAQFRGKPVAIVISRLPNIDIAYGGKTALPANSVTLRRVCTIYSYPYVVELTIWRRVEGFP